MIQKIKNQFFRIIFFTLIPILSYSQDGNIDLNHISLNQISSPSNDGFISLADINTFSKQSNGKIIIGGYFTSINNINTNKIARLNPDGTLDTSFNIGNGFTGLGYTGVEKLLVLNDDKIIVVGKFISYNNITKNNIVRLNSDGTIDTTFNAGTATNGMISSLKIKSNNKILIGGSFTSYNDVSISKIAVLNYDGTLDSTFSINSSSTTGSLIALELQTDNKIIASFLSTSIGTGNAWGYLKRFNQDGTLDNTFFANSSAFISFTGSGIYSRGYIYDIKQLSNNQILVAGNFESFFGQAFGGITRLNSNGTVDTSFVGNGMTVTNPTYIGKNIIYTIDVQSDNKILIGGNFNNINFTNRNCIARLLSNGSLDTTFNPGTGTNLTNLSGKDVIKNLKISQDNSVLICGTFDTYNNSIAKSITRLKGNIIANNDTGIANAGITSTAVANVLSNDLVNILQATNSNCTLVFLNSTNLGITLNTTNGQVNVSNSVPIGNYTLTYQICSIGSLTNCSTGTVTINVVCNYSTTFDLYIKDSASDIGIEPNTISQNVSNSEDIWVRNNQDNALTHQNPIYYLNGNPNYIYVKVTNRSCVNSSGTDQLKIYFAKDVTTFMWTWPSSWSTILPMSQITIPTLQPGAEIILTIPWIVPNPSSFPSNPYSINGSNTFSLLTRIDSSNDPMTFPETGTYPGSPSGKIRFLTNVKNNNNIAWKSSISINLSNE